MNSLITLTTDFGYKDYYVGAVKGMLYSNLGGVGHVVDITHEISPFGVFEAAYTLKKSYYHFPKKTIHIVGVDTEKRPDNKHLAVAYKGHFFIAADNGILSYLIEEGTDSDAIIEIENDIKTVFPTLKIFCEAATHLATGGSITSLGRPLISGLRKFSATMPTINNERSQIVGNIIHIDRYGNAISNITKNTFESIQYHNGKFEIIISSISIEKVYNNFSAVANFEEGESVVDVAGKAIAIFNEQKQLTIAIYRSNLDTVGGASTLLGLEEGSRIGVNFK